MPEAAQQPAKAAQEQDDGTIVPTFNDETTLWEMKPSFSSNNCTLTRLTGQVKVRAETFVAIISQHRPSN